MIENKYLRELRISQSQLVDYLFHAATREDIAAVRQENLAMHQDSKSDIEELRQDFKSEMAAMRQSFKSDITDLRQDFKSEMLAMRQDFKSDITNLRQDFNDDISDLRQDFKSENVSIRQSVKDEIVALRQETITQHKLEIRTILGVGVTLVGVMIGVANFLTHFLIHTT